ncbi:MAG: hypothetical protein JXB88_24995 [Spirochaetales bacterium]|nr:hypothetical protein [Spirochaetales bacterium]
MACIDFSLSLKYYRYDMKQLGIDIGSMYISAVLLENNRITGHMYFEHKGNVKNSIRKIAKDNDFLLFDTIGFTGNWDNSSPLYSDTSLSLIEGIKLLLPRARNIFVLGGQTFQLFFFNRNGEYQQHSFNQSCASGTGSFLDQQAERLGLTIQQLSEKAYQYKGGIPSIATRCAVFAKTDIIHAMQEGFCLDAVCAGICESIGSTIIDSLVKGKTLYEPIVITGGVSLNKKVIDTFGRILDKEVVVPVYSQYIGATGAALLGKKPDTTSFQSTIGAQRMLSSAQKDIETLLKLYKVKIHKNRPPLQVTLSNYPDISEFTLYTNNDMEVFLPGNQLESGKGVFLGFDIGSTSTKALVMDSRKNVLGGFYTKTGGDPVNAVQRCIQEIKNTLEITDSRFIHGVCTTGSGRKMIKELFNADMELNEITAHARAAFHLDRQTDTIIEIGGQDSKFTVLQNGDVVYSNMNYVCAAGTGSFIEEQAKRLDLTLPEFSDIAIKAKAPYTSDRCTVYMERDISLLLSEGVPRNAIALAVLFSVRDNYISKVVNKNLIGNHIVFQGATARNKALVACFEQYLGKPVAVSPYCHLTGAMGAAISLIEKEFSGSSFLWDVRNITIQDETCDLCSNHCSLKVIHSNGRKAGWGMKCGREYTGKKPRKQTASLPEQRYEKRTGLMLSKAAGTEREARQVKIGIPRVLYSVDYFPLWSHFLSQLGFQVLPNRQLPDALAKGKALVNSDFCAPITLAHGYIRQLLDAGVDYIFCPALVNERFTGTLPPAENLLFKRKTEDSYYCYYSEYLPTIISRLTSMDTSGKLISPLLYFGYKSAEEIAQDMYREFKRVFPGIEEGEVISAFLSSYNAFTEIRKNSVQIPSGSGKINIVILGRPYVAFDPVLNVNILKKLEDAGTEVFWQGELPLDNFTPSYASKYLLRMHWKYGKDIIKAAEYSAQHENLFVIFLSCFRCSPDAFLLSYVRDIMEYYKKPFLVLQLDEHNSDVGYSTRIEAGLDSFHNYIKRSHKKKIPLKTKIRDDELLPGDTVLIPHLDEVISRFWAASFKKEGYTAILLESSEQSLNTGYLYTNGGECMPLVSIIGSVIEVMKGKDLDPRKTFFYMPTICMACNFPQFPVLADYAFASAGIKDLKIGLVNMMAPGEFLNMGLSMKILESNIIGSALYKMYNRINPYETEEGISKKVFLAARDKLCESIMKGDSLRTRFNEIIENFKHIPRDESAGRKPRIGLFGDLYVKYNTIINQDIQSLVRELGGELIVPSLTEYAFHFFDADVKLFDENPRPFKLLMTIEQRYEKAAIDILEDQCEPDFSEYATLMEKYDIRHYIAGESTINIGRALYSIVNKQVDAIIHINPIFCCPGVVTSSIYNKIQEDFNIPVINIFYDGTNKPNKVIIPHLYYLNQGKR